MRRRVDVLEHPIVVEPNVRLTVVAEDLHFLGGCANQFHPIAEFDRMHFDAGRIAFEPGDLDAVVAARTAVATMGEGGLRGSQHHCRQQRYARAVFASPAKRYRLSGTFSGHRATTTTMRTTFLKHALTSAVAAATVILVAGGIASAHVDPDPLAMEAGTTGTVAFTIEHGCDGSPTTELEVRDPRRGHRCRAGCQGRLDRQRCRQHPSSSRAARSPPTRKTTSPSP